MQLSCVPLWSRLSLLSLFIPFFGINAFAEEPVSAFDKIPYKVDGSFYTQMTTISGITELASDINNVYGITTIISIFIFFAVALPLIYTIYRFRAKEGDDTPPEQVHGNPVLEIAWTVIPVVLLIFIAVPTWRAIFKHAKAPEGALVVKVIGHQWWWEFEFPDHKVVTANELHLPENTPVRFEVTSADVMHAFWLPQFGAKMDAHPGHVNELAVTTPGLKNPGEADFYTGQCTQLCGDSHALMRFHVVVHSKEQFEKWLASHNNPPQLMTENEKKGAELFSKCMACHTINGTASADLPGPKIGPNLTNFGSRRYLGAGTRLSNRDNLAAWLHEPSKVKPGSLMPNLGLTEPEVEALSSFLLYSTAKSF